MVSQNECFPKMFSWILFKECFYEQINVLKKMVSWMNECFQALFNVEVCFGGKFQLSSSRLHHVCKQRIRRSGYYKRYTQTSLHATKQNTIRNTSLQEHYETMQAKYQSSVHGAEISKFMKEQYVAILAYFEWVFARAPTDYSPDSMSSSVGGVWVWQRWLHILMSCTYNDLWISKSNQWKHAEFTSPFQKMPFPWRSASKADETQDAWSTAPHSGWRGQISSISLWLVYSIHNNTVKRITCTCPANNTHLTHRITELNDWLFTTSSISTACKD